MEGRTGFGLLEVMLEAAHMVSVAAGAGAEEADTAAVLSIS